MSVGTYSDFLTAIGQIESGNNYSFVSWPGYLGRYQFGEEALKAVGFYNGDSTSAIDFIGSWSAKAASYGVTDKASFLASPAAQDAAMTLWTNKIVADLDTLGLRQYDGHVINGVDLTTSGLIAGAHLVGVWNLQSYLQSGGAVDPVDPNGEPVSDYIHRFNGFDTPYDNSAGSSATSGSTGDTSTHTADPSGSTTTPVDTSGGTSTSDPSAGASPPTSPAATPGVVQGTDGADTLTGSASASSHIFGGAGDDLITSAGASDTINGNTGNDTIHGGSGHDVISGGKDNDVLFGDSGSSVINGNLGNDTLFGGTGDSTLRGGAGDDSIVGGAGNDQIWGDKGSDVVKGGAGADTFHTFAGAGITTVLDFNQAEGDRVHIDDGAHFTTVQVGADVVVDLGNGSEVILQNTQLSTLQPGWILAA